MPLKSDELVYGPSGAGAAASCAAVAARPPAGILTRRSSFPPASLTRTLTVRPRVFAAIRAPEPIGQTVPSGDVHATGLLRNAPVAGLKNHVTHTATVPAALGMVVTTWPGSAGMADLLGRVMREAGARP